jgi:ABC-type glycerol-3-phosphate transport system substrate-binding protein
LRGRRRAEWGPNKLYFTAPADATGTTTKLIDQFNEANKGKYKVMFREGSSDTGERLNKLRTQFQAGGEELDIILGDVIWTAELAASGWISDLSDRFPESRQQAFLPGSDPEIQDTVPVVALAKEALQHTRPRPVSPYYSDMSLAMQEQFNASLKGDITPQEAARTLKSDLENIIRQGQEA